MQFDTSFHLQFYLLSPVLIQPQHLPPISSSTKEHQAQSIIEPLSATAIIVQFKTVWFHSLTVNLKMNRPLTHLGVTGSTPAYKLPTFFICFYMRNTKNLTFATMSNGNPTPQIVSWLLESTYSDRLDGVSHAVTWATVKSRLQRDNGKSGPSATWSSAFSPSNCCTASA